MRLKAPANSPISSSDRTSTRADQSPPATARAPMASLVTGRVTRSVVHQPSINADQNSGERHDHADPQNLRFKRELCFQGSPSEQYASNLATMRQRKREKSFTARTRRGPLHRSGSLRLRTARFA